jgi:hypothetical protein
MPRVLAGDPGVLLFFVVRDAAVAIFAHSIFLLMPSLWSAPVALIISTFAIAELLDFFDEVNEPPCSVGGKGDNEKQNQSE